MLTAEPSTLAIRCNTIVPTFGSSSKRRVPRPTLSRAKTRQHRAQIAIGKLRVRLAGHLPLLRSDNCGHAGRIASARKTGAVFAGVLRHPAGLADLKTEAPIAVGVGLRPRRASSTTK